MTVLMMTIFIPFVPLLSRREDEVPHDYVIMMTVEMAGTGEDDEKKKKDFISWSLWENQFWFILPDNHHRRLLMGKNEAM